jgi:hypothetical protein
MLDVSRLGVIRRSSLETLCREGPHRRDDHSVLKDLKVGLQKVRNNSPAGKIALIQFIDAHKGAKGIQILPRSGCRFSFAVLSAAKEKITPLRSLRLCGEYSV